VVASFAPSPELISALDDGWLPRGGRALDVGCGLGTEAGQLAVAGWQVVGLDLSEVALARAAAGHDDAAFLRADVRRLPFGGGSPNSLAPQRSLQDRNMPLTCAPSAIRTRDLLLRSTWSVLRLGALLQVRRLADYP